MPPKDLYSSQVVMKPVNSDGTYGEPIKLDSFEPISIDDEPLVFQENTTLECVNGPFIPLTFTGEFKLSHKKMSRKTFKKWLMSKGINRDLAEWFCRVVKSFKGQYSYQSLYFNGLFVSTSQDLVYSLFDTLFPVCPVFPIIK